MYNQILSNYDMYIEYEYILLGTNIILSNWVFKGNLSRYIIFILFLPTFNNLLNY